MSKFLLRGALLLVAMTSVFSLHAQDFWRKISVQDVPANVSEKRLIRPSSFELMFLEGTALKSFLQNAPTEFTTEAQTQPLILSIPMPDGSTQQFSIVYSPVMAPELAAQFPGIRTYSGQGITDATATIRLDWTNFGFHAMIVSAITEPVYIDPYAHENTEYYIAYYKRDLAPKYTKGDVVEKLTTTPQLQGRTTAGPCFGGVLRKYRLAVATTGEYTAFFGGVANAMSAVITTVNRLNSVYERDLSIRLELIGTNQNIIYTNAASDPYTTTDVDGTMLNQNQVAIDGMIGSPNYDIGHVFSTIDGGGIAALGSVCVPGQKARGATGLANPVGDAYDIDFVAHEIGHQFGANHTFNGLTGNCAGTGNLGITSVEPGSGVTIMGYAGICTSSNIALNSIPYFHATSQAEIYNFITTGAGSACAVPQVTGNSIPNVTVPATSYNIPVNTPFMLTGNATDANNTEVLTYSWEEIDPGSGGNWNSGSKPFFRSFIPSLSKTRVFPRMADIAAGTATIGEFMPANAQNLNFRLTVRDNRNGGGGVCSQDVAVNVIGTAGPFSINSHWSNETLSAGANSTIMWSVGGTNTAPINTANVSIHFSDDGGLTFPYTLVASTPNDGSETIVVPSIKTTRGRIMIKAVNNIFFDMNDANLTVNTTCAAEGAIVSPVNTVTALSGNAALNLGLSPQFAAPFNPAGQITASDAQTNLTALTNGACTQYSNNFNYDVYTFTPTVSGNYTFNRTGSGSVYHIYTGSFDPGSGCTNLFTSNFETTLGTAASVSASLTAGQTYQLVIGVYWTNATTPSVPLPMNYSFTITPPAGGSLVTGSGNYVNPGAGFNYAYVVVNNNTNNIVSISASSDLTNSTTFPPGQYTVYGLSYANTISNLNTYVGGSLTNLLTQMQGNPVSFCANLSKNNVTVNVTGTFPVRFTSLRARKAGEKVNLDWATLTEQNNSHFMVQRSGNGMEFTDIGKVQGAGNSNSRIDYSFIDARPLNGWNYYRVKQVDFDGKFSYTNIASVNFAKDGAQAVIYPNPVKDVLNIEYTAGRAGKVELQVIDSKGAVLIRKNIAVATGLNLETINVGSLSQGMYILRYQQADGEVSFTKFIKQ